MENFMTKPQIREKVNENEDSITKIIDPSDLFHQNIDNWENADIDMLKDELYDSISEWSYMETHPYHDLIHELAVTLYKENMVRIPFDHLVFDSRDKAVIEGYWLYDMGNDELRERIENNMEELEYFHEFELESQMFIESCVIDAQIEELEENTQNEEIEEYVEIEELLE